MANNWWEIQVLCDPALEDLIFLRVETFGCRGTASEMKGHSCLISAYLPQERAHLLDLAALSLLFRQDALCVNLPIPAVQWNLIEEEDWSSSWKQHWHPEEIGDRFVVNPAWLPIPETDRLVLQLDPGVAFGTGAHPTTQLCLEALEMRLGYEETHATIADIGCGSGILSIGAILLGAKQLYAVDTDPLAVKSTRRNRDLNKIDESLLQAQLGSVEMISQMSEEPVDGFVCNILAEVIIDLIPQIDAISKPSTWGIISGVLLDQTKPVADTLEQYGWVVATLWRRKDWCCFTIRRN